MLYKSGTVVRLPRVQRQRGVKDCGCFAIAFCVSLLNGDNPAAILYNQGEMSIHQCFENASLTPSPGHKKKARKLPLPIELILE